jgi:hypothetical protein
MNSGVDLTILNENFGPILLLYGLLIDALFPNNQPNEALRDLKLELFRL